MNNNFKFEKIFFAIIIIAFLNFVLPIQLKSEIVKMEDVVVFGYPVRDSIIKDFTLNKEILTKTEISKIHSFDLTDVLKQMTGVGVASEGNFGGRRVGDGRIKIRGNNAKLLIDGIPASMEVFNCIVGNVLTLNNVERIELIRGGESVLYGSDGIGGVINVVTSEPDKYKSYLNAGFGSYESGYFYGSTQNRIGDFYYSLGYDLKNTSGDIKNTKLRSNDYFMKTGYVFTKYFSAEISGKYYDGDFEDPYELVDWDIDRKGLNIAVKGDLNKNSFYSIQYGINRGEHKSFYFSNGNLKFHSKDFINELRSFHNIKINHTKVLYGFDYKNYGGQILNQAWAYKDEKSANEYAPYLTINHYLENICGFIAGVRYNRNSLYGGVVIPKFGAEKKINEKWRTGVSANKSFRTPSTLQTQINKFAGNKSLEPERAWTYEINASFSDAGIFDWDWSVYKIEGEDRIINRSGKFGNIQNYKHYGFEMQLSKNLFKDINAKIGYNYIYTGKDTANQFRNKINFLFDYAGEKFGAALTGFYLNKLYAASDKTVRLPDFLKADIKLKYKINSKIKIVLEADNILDKKYSLSYDDGKGTAPNHSATPIWSPGIGVFGGLEAEF